MKLHGAVLKEQGVSFAVVVVKKQVVDNRSAANSAVLSYQPLFSGLPVILMAQDSRGMPTYYGRPDIARFLPTYRFTQYHGKRTRLDDKNGLPGAR